MAQDNSSNNISNNCSTDDFFCEREIMMLGIAQIAAGAVSLLGAIVMMLVIVWFKKYRQVTQRLLLYLNIAIILNSTSFVIRGATYSLIDTNEVCVSMAFFGQFSGWCVLSSISCIIMDIFFKAVLDKKTTKCEPIYIMVIFLLPFLFSGIPFIHRKYGKAGPWCWIIGKNGTSIDHLGVAYQYSLWYGPVYALTLVGGVAYVVSVVTIQKKLKWHKIMYSSYHQKNQQRQLLNELKHFRWYPLVYFLINLTPLATRISDSVKPEHAIIELWMITAIIEGLQGLFIALTFSLMPSNREILTCRNLSYVCKERCPCCCCYGNEERNPLQSARGKLNTSRRTEEGSDQEEEDERETSRMYGSAIDTPPRTSRAPSRASRAPSRISDTPLKSSRAPSRGTVTPTSESDTYFSQ